MDHRIATKVGLGKNKSVEIKYKSDDFNRLTVWRKNADVDYICIEPANAQNMINESPYLVSPGGNWNSEVEIMFQ